MNFIGNRIDREALFSQSQKQTKVKSLKKFGIFALGITLSLISFIGYKGVTSKAQATPFGLDNDYQEMIALNERLSSTVPLSIDTISTYESTGDKRVLALMIYFEKYKSPMASMSVAKAFVDGADKNGFGDKWYILPAISGIESGHGRAIPRKGNVSSYNGWGWGGPGRWVYFNSWEDAATRISVGVAKGYGTNLSPERMMASYCPPCAKSGGHWAKVVNQYIAEIKAIHASLG
jgi:hypothetical protein